MDDDGRAVQPAARDPDKLYFKIGEVSELLGVDPTCFATGRPSFSSVPQEIGHRPPLYRRKDVELLLRIKHLLKEKRFTSKCQAVAALRARAPKPRPSKRAQQELFSDDPLPEIRRELADIWRC